MLFLLFDNLFREAFIVVSWFFTTPSLQSFLKRFCFWVKILFELNKSENMIFILSVSVHKFIENPLLFLFIRPSIFLGNLILGQLHDIVKIVQNTLILMFMTAVVMSFRCTSFFFVQRIFSFSLYHQLSYFLYTSYSRPISWRLIDFFQTMKIFVLEGFDEFLCFVDLWGEFVFAIVQDDIEQMLQIQFLLLI